MDLMKLLNTMPVSYAPAMIARILENTFSSFGKWTENWILYWKSRHMVIEEDGSDTDLVLAKSMANFDFGVDSLVGVLLVNLGILLKDTLKAYLEMTSGRQDSW